MSKRRGSKRRQTRGSKPDRRGTPKKARGAQAAIGGGAQGAGQYGSPVQISRDDSAARRQYGLTVQGTDEEFDRSGLHPSLQGLGADDLVDVIIIPDPDAEPPADAGEFLGTLRRDMTGDDGSVIPAGSRIWRDTRPGTLAERAASRGPGSGVASPTTRDLARITAEHPVVAAEPFGSEQPVPSHEAFAQRLERRAPGLAERLSQGLGPDELQQSLPEIMAAMGEAGARPGAYSFGAGKDGRPEIIVTDDPSLIPPDDDQLVIEDLDPHDPDDSGRVLMGSRAQYEAYQERVRAADRRVLKLLPVRDAAGNPRTFEDATRIRVQKTWTADHVLDQHAWLTSHYRNPSADLGDYLAFHIRNTLDEDHRTRSMFWPVDVTQGADTDEGQQIARIIARGLDDSRTYQVTAPMVHQMRDEWTTRPRGVIMLNEGLLPVPAGFCWLDAPWLTETADGRWLPVRAVSWERTAALASSEKGVPFGIEAGQTRMVDAVRIVLWLHLADDVAFGRWKDAEKRVQKTASRIGWLVPQQIALLPFGVQADTRMPYRTNGTELLGLLCTLWSTLGEKIPKSRPLRPQAPAVAKRVSASLKHGTVQIIPLREYEYVSEPNGHFPVPRHWNWRWWVDPHYRHIDAYDDGVDEHGRRLRHAAVPATRWDLNTRDGDDHDVCGVCLANGQTVRISLVHTYPKGPTDKPFITPAESKKRKVWKLKR